MTRVSFTRVSKRRLHPGDAQVQQVLQVFDIVDSRPQGLYLAESLVLQLLREMLPEPRVTFVDAAHPLAFPLVSFPDESRLEGVVARAETSVKVKTRESPVLERLTPNGVEVRVQVEGQSKAKRVSVCPTVVHEDICNVIH